MDKYSFQLCPKIVLFSKDMTKIFLCKRKGEQDYDGVFSFIGGKIEKTDKDLLSGIKREKDEEVGKFCIVKISLKYSTDLLFNKKDKNKMFIPHYIAIYIDGKITLSDEYSEYKWIEVKKIKEFEPKIPTIPTVLDRLLSIMPLLKEEDFEEI
jgi:ADP-ribose pyrophosphatase YjhB (NUDIX family)